MLMLRGGCSANDSHDPVGVNWTFMVCDPTERSENTSPDEPVIVKLCVYIQQSEHMVGYMIEMLLHLNCTQNLQLH